LLKLYGNKASTFVVLVILTFAISFHGTASSAKAATQNIDLYAHPLFIATPVATQGADPLTPTQIITAYGLASTTNGAGRTIAVVDAFDDPTIATDLANFDINFNLPAANFTEHKMSTHISSNDDWALEISLDVEWAHAIAPDATILLVEAKSASLTDLMNAVNYAKSQPGVVAVSMSWGVSEFSSETQSAFDGAFTSTTGIVFFASSGDNGSGVIWPSSSSNVVSVGGTTLNLNSTTGAVLSENAWNGSGGGVSTYESTPAYQSKFGLTYGKRAAPDVSYDADPNTGFYVYDSTPYENETGWWDVGGTSAGAPQWAAIQTLGLSANNANFYQDAGSATYSSYFRDITVGSNGYPAGPGYDLVTGLGSPITTNFAPQNTPDFAISASPDPITINAGSSGTSTITINSLNGFTNPVTLTSTASGGLTTTVNPTSMTPPGSSTLTVTVPTATAAGTYSATVTGISGSISHSTTIMVQIPLSNSEVTISPSSVTLDKGQGQTFTASASGGTSPYTYNWYLNASAVGTNSASYTFDASNVGSFSLYVNATDSASTPVTAESNIASIKVNSALVSPSASASSGMVDQGQSSTFSVNGLSGGTSPYSYQWLQKAPGSGSYSDIGGAVSSTYSFVTSDSTAAGSWSFELQITDDASTPVVVTSAEASIMVNVVPTVSVSPGSAASDVGQSQLFTAIPVGGSGTYSSYQWYLNGSAQVGQTGSTFSCYFASVCSYLIAVTVTDSLGVTSAQSTNTSVMVNSALVAPAVTPTPNTVDQGQTPTLTSTAISTGTGSYTYQWFEQPPDGSYMTVGSNSGSFSFATSDSNATGNWSFLLQVTDNTGSAVNSTAVSVTVNAAPTVTIAPVDQVTIDAGQTQIFTANPSGGTGALTYQWNLNGSPVGSDSSTYYFSGSPGSYTVACTITDDASLPASAASNTVSVTVNQLTIAVTQSANGQITPGTIDVNYGDSQTFTITPDTGYYIDSIAVDGSAAAVTSSAGQTISFTNVQASHTISASFALTPSPASTLKTALSPTPTPTPTPTTTVPATTSNGATVDLEISGNITSSQISSVKIATNQSALTTTVSFILTGESGSTGFGNVTIPKSAVTYGTTPTVYINDRQASTQGYTQTSNSYCVWYTTNFNTDEVTIMFITASPPSGPATHSSLLLKAIFGVVAVIVIAAVVAAVLMLRKSKTKENKESRN